MQGGEEARKQATGGEDRRRPAPSRLSRISGQWLPPVAEAKSATGGLDPERGEGADSEA